MLHSRGVERGISYAVIVLIAWLGISTDLIVFRPWIKASLRPGRLITCLVLFNLLWIMAEWSLIMAGWTEAGTVPPDFTRSSSEKHWCKKCARPRPVRAHHCRWCGVCRLRMDHHCPWIGNCVAYRNHGHFLRFLSYASGGLAIAMLASVSYLVQVLPGAMMLDEASEARIIIVILNGVFSFCLLVMLGFLTGFQWSSCLRNRTTIEQLEIDNTESRARRRNLPPPIFPYDLGSLANLKAILGERIWAWPLPLSSAWQVAGQGDGLEFVVSSESPWPPEGSEDSPDSQPGSRSDSALPQQKRAQRFRRGSEGYMIPFDQVGVKFKDDSDSDEPEEHAIRRPYDSAPLLTLPP